MNVTVKTGGLLHKYLPAQRTGNRAQLDVAEGATALDVMRQLGMPPEGSYLVIVNDELLPEERRGEVRLRDGDRLSINPPLRGG